MTTTENNKPEENTSPATSPEDGKVKMACLELLNQLLRLVVFLMTVRGCFHYLGLIALKMPPRQEIMVEYMGIFGYNVPLIFNVWMMIVTFGILTFIIQHKKTRSLMERLGLEQYTSNKKRVFWFWGFIMIPYVLYEIRPFFPDLYEILQHYYRCYCPECHKDIDWDVVWSGCCNIWKMLGSIF